MKHSVENFAKSGRVAFEICKQTDRQTYRYTIQTHSSQYFAPLRGEVVTCKLKTAHLRNRVTTKVVKLPVIYVGGKLPVTYR